MQIGNYNIDKNSKTFIIAELSANHNGNLEIAIETIKAAKRAGANCVKFQTYTANTITIDSSLEDFIIKDTIWSGRKLFDLYSEAYTPWEWHEQLFKIAKQEGLECFSSPFDKSAVDFLENLKVPAYKIASFEITDIPLIEYVASKGKPIIISTGIANDDDIELAISSCKKMGNDNICLLKCTSSYPALIEEANLKVMLNFGEKYDVIFGLSDHTLGSTVPVVAAVLGAKIIEKHFILNHEVGGPDASFSLDESEFSKMVSDIREAEKSLGNGCIELTSNQAKSRSFARSLYIVKDVFAGEVITIENVKSIRPGFGLHPKYLTDLLGKRFKNDVKRGERMNFQLIE